MYHVMLRGINKQPIFEEAEDYQEFLSCLSEVKQISKFKLYAYCLMGNHVHLLLKEDGEALSQVFKRIGARYVFWFNWKYGRSGHLFQDRFKSKPVESDDYFVTVLAYIYQNPVKEGLCKRSEDYEWCSRKQLGTCDIVDEKELFEIIPIKTIMERGHEDIEADLLAPKIGRGMSMTDADVYMQMKVLGDIQNVAGFQALSRANQAQVIIALLRRGASVRQVTRVTGLGRGLITRIYRGYRAT